jgi:hypothetical protein
MFISLGDDFYECMHSILGRQYLGLFAGLQVKGAFWEIKGI